MFSLVRLSQIRLGYIQYPLLGVLFYPLPLYYSLHHPRPLPSALYPLLLHPTTHSKWNVQVHVHVKAPWSYFILMAALSILGSQICILLYWKGQDVYNHLFKKEELKDLISLACSFFYTLYPLHPHTSHLFTHICLMCFNSDSLKKIVRDYLYHIISI